MTEHDWLTSTDPAAMLEWLQTSPGLKSWPAIPSGRKLRLFACASLRALPEELIGIEGEGVLVACGFAERYADGLVGLSEMLSNAGNQKRREYVCEPDARTAAGLFCESNFPDYDGPLRAALLRDIFGNPFVKIRCEECEGTGKLSDWSFTEFGRRDDIRGGPCKQCSGSGKRFDFTHRVLSLAQGIYDDRAFERMPILADALEEAGCADETILRHCRGEELQIEFDENLSGSVVTEHKTWHALSGPHVRGCWVLDLILGKE